MTQLVFINNNQVVTDSLTISKMFGKDHKHVLRDIETQIEKLKEAGELEWGCPTLDRPITNTSKINNGIPNTI